MVLQRTLVPSLYTLQIAVTLYSDVTTCILIDRYKRFEGLFRFHLQGINVPFLNLEKVEIPPKC
jgi:hypothetical protein